MYLKILTRKSIPYSKPAKIIIFVYETLLFEGKVYFNVKMECVSPPLHFSHTRGHQWQQQQYGNL